MDKLLNIRNVSGWRAVLEKTAKQMGAEASEEAFTEIANILADAAIMGEKSAFNQSVQQYMADGLSEEAAKQKAFLAAVGQVGLAGLGGTLSGFAMGGTKSTFSAYGTGLASRTGQGYNDLITQGETAGKMSREKWYPDLPKTKLQELKDWIKRDIRTSENSIGETANWAFREFDGLPVFAIYSTQNAEDPTLLYESKGEKAKFEKDYVADLMEVKEYVGCVDGKSEVIGRVFVRNWMRTAGSSPNDYGTVGRGRGAGDASVLQGPSRRKPSPALESVLRNLFENPEGRSGEPAELKQTRQGYQDIKTEDTDAAGNLSWDNLIGKTFPPYNVSRSDANSRTVVKRLLRSAFVAFLSQKDEVKRTIVSTKSIP